MVAQLDRMAAHEGGVRSGDDPEDVHRMRVASRRLRSAAREFGDCFAEADVELLDEARSLLGGLADALGRVRDLDVQIAALRADADYRPDDADAIERLVADRTPARESARAAMVAALDSGGLGWLRETLRQRLMELAAANGGPDDPKAAGLALRSFRRLRRRGRRALRASTMAELHRLRLAAKRFRYSGEVLRSALGSALEEPIAQAIALQDVLGAIQDDEVAVDTLLCDLLRIGSDPARARDVSTIARLIAQRRKRRDQHLARLAELWTKLPRSRKLRRRLEGSQT